MELMELMEIMELNASGVDGLTCTLSALLSGARHAWSMPKRP